MVDPLSAILHIIFIVQNIKLLNYREICGKGSDVVVSAVCYTIFTIYPSAHKQLRRHHPEPLSRIPLYYKDEDTEIIIRITLI